MQADSVHVFMRVHLGPCNYSVLYVWFSSTLPPVSGIVHMSASGHLRGKAACGLTDASIHAHQWLLVMLYR